MSADIIDIHTRAHIFQREAEQAVAEALSDRLEPQEPPKA